MKKEECKVTVVPITVDLQTRVKKPKEKLVKSSQFLKEVEAVNPDLSLLDEDEQLYDEQLEDIDPDIDQLNTNVVTQDPTDATTEQSGLQDTNGMLLQMYNKVCSIDEVIFLYQGLIRFRDSKDLTKNKKP